MGRHSSGENNYSLSKGAIAALIALILIIALIIWFFFVHDDATETQAEPNCVSGELTLPIAASNEEIAQPIVDAYADNQPVVRDYCVTPELVDDISEAAVVVAPDSPVTNGALDEASRTPATSERVAVASDPAGLTGGSEIENPAEISADDVDYSTATDAAIAASVASVLAGSPEEARAALGSTGGSYQVASKSAATDNFVALDGATVVYTAIPLTADGDITEDQARAGADFAEFAANAYEGAESTDPIDPSVWAAAAQVATQAQIAEDGGSESDAATGESSAESVTESTTESSSESTTAEAADEVTNTLFLLDTSQAMTPYADVAADAVGATANAVIDEGQQVALWNYSSPLNPGVTQSWRTNVPFTEEQDAVANRAAALGNAGQSNTRESVRAAVETVAGLEGEVHVVLITAGTSDAGDDAAYLAALEPLLAEGVTLSVVHVGEAPTDETIEGLAESATQVDTAEDLAGAVNDAAGLE